MIMIKLLFTLFFFVSIVASAQPAERDELKKLQTALDAARTQTDLNLASGALADYWDKELLTIEKKIEKKLDTRAVALFQKTKRSWRTHRSTQVIFEGDFYRGGSIQPLIHNTTFTSLTERRVKDLEQLYKENYEQK